VFVHHSDGTKRRLDRPIARSDEELERWVRNTAARAGLTERRFDEGRPWLILRLPGGPRLFALMSVTASVCLSIRVHRLDKVTIADLVGEGMMTEELGRFLAAAVRARLNIIYSGGTNAGKTTLQRAGLNECPEEDRLVTVEDSYELGMDQMPERHPDVVPLEAREPNAEGRGEITMRQLVKLALRMNPTRVVVGEVRGDEILHMLHDMTMGNDGSMCTIHADSAAGVFGRIALFAIESPEHLEPKDVAPLAAEAIDLIVHITYDLADGAGGRGKARFIRNVLEVTGVADDGAGLRTNEVFRPGPDGHAVFCGPVSARTLERLEQAGWKPRRRPPAAPSPRGSR
jgi:Flp pilus assembly CpaF family ATPase